jgi:sulfur carrier protein
VIRVNGVEHSDVFDNVTVLMTRLAIEPRGVAVAVNGEIIRRDEWALTALVDGDVVEIVSAAAGG